MKRNKENEDLFKSATKSELCIIKGNSCILKDTVNPKLYHLFQATDKVSVRDTGIIITRI